ncbi:hypothetical protein BESB_029740 [Besnoitia besnoiti]|uniref:Uncharacterized protein n=1 Tax=Besnoitia besnoiti TaxID=94643 RepID=A0A2A9M6Q8_BESBE|nr:hypothetical protein BESB_029740 [Besnoitia besnoiti]PFH31100.1 hypothetical protein BESB_029740 [Besnoitia besnoiti]
MRRTERKRTDLSGISTSAGRVTSQEIDNISQDTNASSAVRSPSFARTRILGHAATGFEGQLLVAPAHTLERHGMGGAGPPTIAALADMHPHADRACPQHATGVALSAGRRQFTCLGAQEGSIPAPRTYQRPAVPRRRPLPPHGSAPSALCGGGAVAAGAKQRAVSSTGHSGCSIARSDCVSGLAVLLPARRRDLGSDLPTRAADDDSPASLASTQKPPSLRAPLKRLSSPSRSLASQKRDSPPRLPDCGEQDRPPRGPQQRTRHGGTRVSTKKNKEPEVKGVDGGGGEGRGDVTDGAGACLAGFPAGELREGTSPTCPGVGGLSAAPKLPVDVCEPAAGSVVQKTIHCLFSEHSGDAARPLSLSTLVQLAPEGLTDDTRCGVAGAGRGTEETDRGELRSEVQRGEGEYTSGEAAEQFQCVEASRENLKMKLLRVGRKVLPPWPEARERVGSLGHAAEEKTQRGSDRGAASLQAHPTPSAVEADEGAATLPDVSENSQGGLPGPHEAAKEHESGDSAEADSCCAADGGKPVEDNVLLHGDVVNLRVAESTPANSGSDARDEEETANLGAKNWTLRESPGASLATANVSERGPTRGEKQASCTEWRNGGDRETPGAGQRQEGDFPSEGRKASPRSLEPSPSRQKRRSPRAPVSATPMETDSTNKVSAGSAAESVSQAAGGTREGEGSSSGERVQGLEEGGRVRKRRRLN